MFDIPAYRDTGIEPAMPKFSVYPNFSVYQGYILHSMLWLASKRGNLIIKRILTRCKIVTITCQELSFNLFVQYLGIFCSFVHLVKRNFAQPVYQYYQYTFIGIPIPKMSHAEHPYYNETNCMILF